MPASRTLTPEQRRERARIAANIRNGGDTREVQARREAFAASRVEQRVQEIIDSAPPLSQDQRDRIAAIIQKSPNGRRGAAA